MKRLRVAPIVEGHGEVQCVRILLERTWAWLEGEHVDVLQPIRQPRGQLLKKDRLMKAVGLGIAKLSEHGGLESHPLVLILLDADEDCPGTLGPELLGYARKVDPRTDVTCVLAKVEYETWFAAAAESLDEYLKLTGRARRNLLKTLDTEKLGSKNATSGAPIRGQGTARPKTSPP